MWILILTITAFGNSNADAGYAISSVPGFTSEAACQSAASSWLRQRTPDSSRHMRTALCAKA